MLKVVRDLREVPTYAMLALKYTGKNERDWRRRWRRWQAAGWVTVTSRGMGSYQRVRLTTRGLRLLEPLTPPCELPASPVLYISASGTPVPSEPEPKKKRLIAPRATSTRYLDHTLSIVDLFVALLLGSVPPDVLTPSWTVQRHAWITAPAIPDLLAVWRKLGLILLFEIDCGSEHLTKFLIPKLGRLQDYVRDQTPGAAVTILVLTPRLARQRKLRQDIQKNLPSDISILVESLPDRPGPQTLALFQKRYAQEVASWSQTRPFAVSRPVESSG